MSNEKIIEELKQELERVREENEQLKREREENEQLKREREENEQLKGEHNKYTLDDIKREAKQFLKRRKGNKTTCKNYRTSINYFIYVLESNKDDFTTIDDDNKNDVLELFKKTLMSDFTYKVESVDDVLGYDEETFKPINRKFNLNANSVNTHLRRIITFFNQRLHLRIKNFKKCQVDKPQYKALKIDHVKLLIDECSNCWSKKEIATRNSVLIRLLFNEALRIREALEIEINDTNFIDYDSKTNQATLKKNLNTHVITIHQKGRHKKDKSICISKDMAKYIVDYINIKKVPSDYIFSTTQVSTDGKAKPLMRQYFNKDMIKLAKYVDDRYDTRTTKEDSEIYNYNNISEVIKNNSTHVYRHSRATWLLKVKKVDIKTVQRVLRHEALTSTEVYTESNDGAVNNININNDI